MVRLITDGNTVIRDQHVAEEVLGESSEIVRAGWSSTGVQRADQVREELQRANHEDSSSVHRGDSTYEK
jgi:hypothetical protein